MDPMGDAPPAPPDASSAEKKPTGNRFSHNLTRLSPDTIVWLHSNLEVAEGVSLGRHTLYEHYVQHCTDTGQDPVNTASFGKLIRSVFPNLKTRRLGTRGNSKYHYYGIRVKDESNLHFDADQVGGPTTRVKVNKDGKLAGAEGAGADDHTSLSEYLDTTVTMPQFPSMRTVDGLRDYADFAVPYQAHCERVLQTLCSGGFDQIEEMWGQFWGVIAAHFRSSIQTEAGLKFIDQCDAKLFQAMHDALVTDVICNMPEDLTKDLRYFAKHMESYMKTALEGYPKEMLDAKLVRVRSFAHTLRRYTSLNHLAQAANGVIVDSTQSQQMLRDMQCLDFEAILDQASPICKCPRTVVKELQAEFEALLRDQCDLLKWGGWMQKILKDYIAQGSGRPESRTRKFLTRWCYFSSLVMRDITLRSADSFGSFHLLRLLCDEYFIYLVELVSTRGVTVLDTVPAGCEHRNRLKQGGGGAPAPAYGAQSKQPQQQQQPPPPPSGAGYAAHSVSGLSAVPSQTNIQMTNNAKVNATHTNMAASAPMSMATAP